MSDNFERVKSEILRRTAENGGPSNIDLLEALEGSNDDFDDGISAVTLLLSNHVEADKERAKTQAKECAERHRLLITTEFTRQHAADKFADAETHAAMVAEAAEKAATKAAVLVAETAKKAAGVRVHAAEDAATVLTDAASAAPKRFTKEQIVANFWYLVALLALGGIINRLTEML